MTMQEISTAIQYNLPIKIFILNNQYMGMVRQWQELLHEKNYSESYSEALPDFMNLRKIKILLLQLKLVNTRCGPHNTINLTNLIDG